MQYHTSSNAIWLYISTDILALWLPMHEPQQCWNTGILQCHECDFAQVSLWFHLTLHLSVLKVYFPLHTCFICSLKQQQPEVDLKLFCCPVERNVMDLNMSFCQWSWCFLTAINDCSNTWQTQETIFMHAHRHSERSQSSFFLMWCRISLRQFKIMMCYIYVPPLNLKSQVGRG